MQELAAGPMNALIDCGSRCVTKANGLSDFFVHFTPHRAPTAIRTTSDLLHLAFLYRLSCHTARECAALAVHERAQALTSGTSAWLDYAVPHGQRPACR